MTTKQCLTIGLTAAVCLLIPVFSASAQDSLGSGRALGSGDALDANTQLGSQGRNVRGRTPSYGARNLVVTGNVAGGRGFRGSVGYTAANDFRGATGSDDLYQFRAGSALSAPYLSAQTFEQFKYSQFQSVLEYDRTSQAASMSSISQAGLANQLMENRIQLDQYSALHTSAQSIDAAAQPTILGVMPGQDGQSLAASGSSIRGLQVGPVQTQPQFLGLTTYDMARVIEDVQAGRLTAPVGSRFESRFNTLMDDPRVDVQPDGSTVDATQTNTRVDPSQGPDHRAILESIARRYANAQNVDVHLQANLLNQLDDEYEDLRNQLLGMKAPPGESGPAIVPVEDVEPNEDAGQPEGDEQVEERRFDPNRLGAMLRHNRRIETYAGTDETRFNELLGEAEEKLRSGQYFWAENRFDRALRFMPGNPMARAGRAHAQIGAGLYVPAALSLRQLLTSRPEMIDVSYEANLIPNAVRLSIAIDYLQGRLNVGRDRGSNAFLLAYIGHQTDDRATIEQGLDAMTEADPQDTLIPLLRSIWLAEPEK